MLTVRIRLRHDLLFQPSSDQGGECGQMNSPNYVNNCNYDGAYNVLAKVNHYHCRTMQIILLVLVSSQCMSLNFRPWGLFRIKIRVKAQTNMT